jgi:hypothetical protein
VVSARVTVPHVAQTDITRLGLQFAIAWRRR